MITGYAFNSLFEIQFGFQPRTRRKHEETFNSLFEIHKRESDTDRGRHGRPFNSLFEIPKKKRVKGAKKLQVFQFSF